jgi:hypothetical protein
VVKVTLAVADYDGHLSINQICRELRKPLVLTVRPAVLDCNILAFHESCFLQAALERSHQVRRVIERSNPKKPDHRHRPLLRTRRERPSCRRATEEGNELASLQPFELHPISLGQDRHAGYRTARDPSAGMPDIYPL